MEEAPPLVRRVFGSVNGGTILHIGIAMIVLSGPAIMCIPVSLAVLTTDFISARRWPRKARKMFKPAKACVAGSSKRPD